MALVVGGIAAWLQPYAEKVGADFTTNADFGGGGLLLTLVLFILARVFRKGAEMRADLEGTV
jgi:hypothetical protein